MCVVSIHGMTRSFFRMLYIRVPCVKFKVNIMLWNPTKEMDSVFKRRDEFHAKQYRLSR